MEKATEDQKDPVPLTREQKARIERNRQKALLLKKSRVANHPYKQAESVIYIANKKVIDTGAGFLLEEEAQQSAPAVVKVVEQPSVVIPPDRPECEECMQQIGESYLLTNFGLAVCDGCRDIEDKHSLMTKSQAKTDYLLKDCDFDLREPPLRFISKKNPHKEQWGEMKLYVKCQVVKRAMEVWETEEKLEEERDRRDDKREKTKKKRFNKKMKELRMSIRSSLYDRTTAAHHHEFGPEEYNEDDDEYSKTCTTCNHTIKYEKL